MNHNAPHKEPAARHRWQNAFFNKRPLARSLTPGLQSTTPRRHCLSTCHPYRHRTYGTSRTPIFHGGALPDGLVPSYRNFSTGFSSSQWLRDHLPDYRCAPDYQYPTQLNEALDLWDDLTKRQGYAPDQIILGGDSAGANLALALLLKLRI